MYDECILHNLVKFRFWLTRACHTRSSSNIVFCFVFSLAFAHCLRWLDLSAINWNYKYSTMSHRTDISGQDRAEWKRFFLEEEEEEWCELAAALVTSVMELKAQSERFRCLSSNNLWKIGKISIESTLVIFWLDILLLVGHVGECCDPPMAWCAASITCDWGCWGCPMTSAGWWTWWWWWWLWACFLNRNELAFVTAHSASSRSLRPVGEKSSERRRRPS